VDVEARLRGDLDATSANVGARSFPAAIADLGEEARTKEEPVHEHGHEETLDVVRGHVTARLQHRPRARRTFQGGRPAHGAAYGDDLDLARRPDEVDDPARDRLVQEHAAHRRAQRRNLLQIDDRLEPAEWMAAELLVDDLRLVLRIGIAE